MKLKANPIKRDYERVVLMFTYTHICLYMAWGFMKYRDNFNFSMSPSNHQRMEKMSHNYLLLLL
jgi:hypothetical protein